MGKEICELKVSTEILSFFNHTDEITQISATLDRIDEMTYSYENAQSFFDYFIKTKKSRISNDFERENGYSPTGYLLGENGIYVLKDGQKKRALFKNIQIGDKEYPLEEILLSRLYNGNLIQLYLCDQFRSLREEYDSLFAGVDNYYIEKLELMAWNAQDLRETWNFLKNSNRKYQIMRFVLPDLKNYEGDLNELFYEEIPSHENYRDGDRQNSQVKNDSVQRTYRWPFNND